MVNLMGALLVIGWGSTGQIVASSSYTTILERAKLNALQRNPFEYVKFMALTLVMFLI